jgi:hypothetical protein
MTIEDIATKILKEEDGEFSYAIKALVENDSDDEEVSIEIQGLDEDGFEIYSLYLSGIIPIGESKYLTTREDYAEPDLFHKIVKWQIK